MIEEVEKSRHCLAIMFPVAIFSAINGSSRLKRLGDVYEEAKMADLRYANRGRSPRQEALVNAPV